MLARINLDNGWFPGLRAVGLYHYDTSLKAWTARGDYAPDVNIPQNYRSILWEDNGHNGTGYQGFMATIMFDQYNRMHFASTINNNNASPDATDVVYAYSDNGGNTFHSVDDSIIPALPMRASGSNRADIVASAPNTSVYYWNFSGVYINGLGQPAVSYWRKSDGAAPARTQHWDPTTQEWSPDYDNPTTGTSMVQHLVDPNGVITYVEQGKFGLFKRALNPTETMSQNYHGMSLVSADRLALRNEGLHIMIGSTGSGHLSVEQIEYKNTGGFLREVWTELPGNNLSSLKQATNFPHSPNVSEIIYGGLESPANWGENYASRLRGMLHAPVVIEAQYLSPWASIPEGAN